MTFKTALAGQTDTATTRAGLINSLLQRTAEGHSDAFRHLYDMTSGMLFAIIMRIVQDRSLADTALCAVYSAIWSGAAEQVTRGIRHEAWMVALAQRQAFASLTHQRDGQVDRVTGQDLTTQAHPTITGHTDLPLNQEDLLDCLSPADRTMLVAVYASHGRIDILCDVFSVQPEVLRARLRTILGRIMTASLNAHRDQKSLSGADRWSSI